MSRRRRVNKPKRACDRIFRHLVRERDDHTCRRCGFRDPDSVQCAHILGRGYPATRCELDNALTLCPPCHLDVDTNPVAMVELIEATIGRDRYEELLAMAHGHAGREFDWHAERARLSKLQAERGASVGGG